MSATRITPLKVPCKTRFWTAKVCPFAQGAAIALAEKDVQHESVFVDLLNKPKELFEVHPEGKVPALEDAGHILIESQILMEYADETWEKHGVNLLPKDTALRAKARIQCERIKDLVIGPFFQCIYCTDETERKLRCEKLASSCVQLVSGFDPNGPYILGKEFTVADIKLAPFKQRFVVLEKGFGITFPDSEPLRRLGKWFNAVEAHPGFIATRPEDDYLIATYKSIVAKKIENENKGKKILADISSGDLVP